MAELKIIFNVCVDSMTDDELLEKIQQDLAELGLTAKVEIVAEGAGEDPRIEDFNRIMADLEAQAETRVECGPM